MFVRERPAPIAIVLKSIDDTSYFDEFPEADLRWPGKAGVVECAPGAGGAGGATGAAADRLLKDPKDLFFIHFTYKAFEGLTQRERNAQRHALFAALANNSLHVQAQAAQTAAGMSGAQTAQTAETGTSGSRPSTPRNTGNTPVEGCTACAPMGQQSPTSGPMQTPITQQPGTAQAIISPGLGSSANPANAPSTKI